MIKVVFPHAFNFGLPVARLVDVHSGGIDHVWMQKRAAVLSKEISEIRPEQGHSFIHLITMGAQEFYGANRNGDGFNEKSARWEAFDPKPDGPTSVMLDGGLMQYHPTFKKYAHVYKDHCFPAGTPIVMADHSRRAIEDVQESDFVLTRTGACRVQHVMRREYDGIGVVLALSGIPTPLCSTYEHPYFVLRREQVHCRHMYNRLSQNEHHGQRCLEYRESIDSPQEASANSLRKGDYLLFPRLQLGTRQENPAFARLLGWVASEGCLGKHGSIQFTFASWNHADLAAVRTCFDDMGIHCGTTIRADGLTMLSACSKALHARLTKYIIGTFNTKQFTSAVFDLDPVTVRHILSAYIDGDGCVQLHGAHQGELRIRSSSPSMLYVLSDLIRALGVPARVNMDSPGGPMISPTNGRTYISRPSGVVNVGRTFAGEVATGRKAAAVIEPERKQTRDLLDDMYLVRIDAVRHIQLHEPVFNLEVETQHEYIAGEVLVHNCNKDPELASGDVVAEAYNPEMHRGELIIRVQDDKWAPELEKLANGEDVPFSMSCVLDPQYPVLTIDGYKSIVDVVVGDKVLTHVGKWQRVKAVNRRVYSGKVRTFHLNGLPLPLELTADHPMYAVVFTGSRELEAVQATAKRYFRDPVAFDSAVTGWTHAEHIEVGDRLLYQRVPSMPGYPALDDLRLARLLGYFIAEGSFGYNEDRACTVQFTCNVADEMPRRIASIVAELWPDVTVKIVGHHNSKFALAVSLFSTECGEWIKSLVGSGSKKKHLCPELFNGSREVKLSFMGAWCDGDGFIDKKGIHWSSVNRDLILQGRDLLASIDIPSSIYRIDHTGQLRPDGSPSNSIEYTLNVSSVEAAALAPWSDKVIGHFGQSIAVLRSKPACMRALPDGRYAYRVKEVTERVVTDVQTYNIEVEGDESYLLAGLISHNCKVPYDICSACLNKAANRKEYCKHLKHEMGQVKQAGHQIFAINDRPMLFDISGVFRPADRIAYGLRKVASTGVTSEEAVVSSAEIAELWGLSVPRAVLLDSSPRPVQEKLAAIERLAAMEKRIEATGRAINPSVDAGVPTGEAPQETIDSMRSSDWNGLMGALAQAKICLPVKDFFRLVLGDKYDSVAGEMDGVQSLLPGMFSRMLDSGDGVEDVTGMSAYDPATSLVPKAVRDKIGSLSSDMSVDEEPVRHRVQVMIIRGGDRGQGAMRKVSADLRASKTASYMARQYAAYQLSFFRAIDGAGDDLTTGLTVLRNYAA
jgi:intein/homing endonuclease